jgi:hypothetical protein
MGTSAPASEPVAQRPRGDGADRDRGLLRVANANALSHASRRHRTRAERRKAKWDFLLRGERPEPIPAVREPVEEIGGIGICCSGGGIRSAAFNLGALQALQREDRISGTDYIAAVSGGSYIAAAYTMVATAWTPNTPEGDRNDSDPTLLAQQQPFAPGSPEEQYLRNRSSYMAPDASAKVYLGFRLLFGLLLNVVFLALPLVALTLLATVYFYGPFYGSSLRPPAVAYVIPGVLLGLATVVGAICVVRRAPNDSCRRISELWSVRLLAAAAFAAIITLVTPLLAGWRPGVSGETLGTATGASGLTGLLAGLAASLREALSATKRTAGDLGPIRGWAAKRSPRLRRAIMLAGAAVAGPLLVLTCAVATLVFAVDRYGSDGPIWLLACAVIVMVPFLAMYFLADLTSWSLHPFYKRRLCTAFALKRIRPWQDERTRHRGSLVQESAEGIAIERDYDSVVSLSQTALDGAPTLLVCAAANVSDPGATPPGRRVTSFTFSAHTIGGPLVGALPTREFEAAFDGHRCRRDLSLPAAVAMSGAAISPSSGKMGNRSLTALMTLANMRLGVWVPNPTWVAGSTPAQRRRFKRPRPWYLLLEMLGRNRLDARYLYVSDGGHYENLGLVELLRRGCTAIYCFDASGGPTFAALGDAVALARSEIGVEIDIDPKRLTAAGEPLVARDCAIRVPFRYRSGEAGVLIYARNVVGPGAPWDVRAHQIADARFPNDSTTDQLYTDQKFESYRALGERAGARAIELMDLAVPAQRAARRNSQRAQRAPGRDLRADPRMREAA